MDVQGLLEFLAYEPFYHNDVWRAVLQKPLLGRHPDATTPLRSLMQGVMLRRTRAHVGTCPSPLHYPLHDPCTNPLHYPLHHPLHYTCTNPLLPTPCQSAVEHKTFTTQPRCINASLMIP